ncbi:unnamed protein product [Mycena citricolor]|uniref:Metal homeostatis protein bsd2 n=1 Tax=Mycena citricolor TaxID=2018698 RepID=A0AAD2H7H4_9AGAR|nr:unnamed protein product [Mycena citricolor]
MSSRAHYSPLPHDEWGVENELDAAFDNDDETLPLTASVGSSQPPQLQHVPGAYDFEREYDLPPPGSPPRPSSVALPNDIGNSNGRLPGAIARPAPRISLIRRAVGALLPTHYSRIPSQDPTPRTVGGGSENDGVFANVMAKPSRSQAVRGEDGQVYIVPEDAQKEAPPSYAAAQQEENVPPYWETTVHAPSMGDFGTDMIIEDLPTGSAWIFAANLLISFFFQFVGFMFTFLLSTSHAARYGSRAGLGITLIQFGFSSRSGSSEGGFGDDSDYHPNATTGNSTSWNTTTPGLTPPAVPDAGSEMDITVGGIAGRDWLSFLLMTLGWFILLSSFIGYWRVKRWERSIRRSSQPLTVQDVEADAATRRDLSAALGINVDPQPTSQARPRTAEEQAAEEQLERDLRAAGLL